MKKIFHLKTNVRKIDRCLDLNVELAHILQKSQLFGFVKTVLTECIDYYTIFMLGVKIIFFLFSYIHPLLFQGLYGSSINISG